jgi:ABC-type dipeptide/oligopeptide/nickel transport system permease component
MLARFVLRRLLIAILQLAGVALFVFFLIRALPADPVARLVGMNASKDAYAQAAHALGLDLPLWQQLANYVGVFSSGGKPGILQGNFGTSWVSDGDVLQEILGVLPVSLELVSYALLISVAIAVPLGLASARKSGGLADRITLVWGLFAGAQPDYWWGLLFVYVFFFWLGIAPPPMGRLDAVMSDPTTVTGFITIDTLLDGDFSAFLSGVAHLALPVLTLVFGASGAMVKMVRSNTLRALNSDYILYARASGIPERQVARYALRAALTPAITLLGIFYGVMLSAVVTIEVVFSLEGIGQYSVRAVLNYDYPAIQGVVLTVAMVSLMIYLLLDIVHVFLDPRVRY